MWQSFWNWLKGLSREVKVALIGAAAVIIGAIIGLCHQEKPPPPAASSPTPTATPSPVSTPTASPTPNVPQATKAEIFGTSDGIAFIEATYDPPELRRGDTLSFEAATSESFNDLRPLLPQTNIESVAEGHTKGRLLYDPVSQPVWFRFLIIDAQGKPWYGKPVEATRR